MYLRKLTLIEEQDSDFRLIWFANRRQQVTQSTTIMLNPKTLDNTGTGYLEFKGVAPH
jgi:hypothetical protein